MRVVEYDHYGDPSVLQLRDREPPAIRPGKILVRVRAAALNPKDVLSRAGKYPWLAGRHFPKRVGYDWSGEAVAIGAGVRDIREGDALFGMIESWSGGACAELVLVSPKECATKPRALGWPEAAAIPLAASTALQALRDVGGVRNGDRVLVNGASGGVGVFAIQIAKALGAHVTTLTSATNRELAHSLGADETLDYRAWDAASASTTYDTFFDVFGNRNYREIRPLLSSRGTFVSTVPKRHVLLAQLRTLFSRPRARLVMVRSRRADLEWLAAATSRGVLRAVIDRTWPLSEVAEAQRYVASKRARGKVVITVREDGDQKFAEIDET